MVNENLFKAVEKGDIEAVKNVLAEEKFNAATYYGAKSIIFAVKKERTEILKTLLESSKNINRESFWRLTAQESLCIAIQGGYVEILELLFKYGAAADREIFDNPFILNAMKTANSEIVAVLFEVGFRILRKGEKFFDDQVDKTEEFCEEDGIIIPEKYSSASNFIQYAKEGKISKVKKYMAQGVDNKVLIKAIDGALKNGRWETVNVILEYCSEIEIYTECLKKTFLKAAFSEDVEKVKFYLEKLIENVVGVLTDETGKSTLEIALENSPEDVRKILSNYNFPPLVLHKVNKRYFGFR